MGRSGPALVSAVPGDLVVVPVGSQELRGMYGEVLSVEDGGVKVESPGVYEVVPGGGVVVVNTAPEESRFSALAPGIFDSLGVPLVPRVEGHGSDRAEVAEVRLEVIEGRQGVWRWGIGLALFLVLLETLMSGKLSRSTGGAL